MNGENFQKKVDNLKKTIESGIESSKDFISSSFGELLATLIEKLQLSSDKKFVFLLVGRTGVGKSSTVMQLISFSRCLPDLNTKCLDKYNFNFAFLLLRLCLFSLKTA